MFSVRLELSLEYCRDKVKADCDNGSVKKTRPRERGPSHLTALNAARPPARYSNYRVMWKTRVTPGIRGIPCQPAPNHVTCGTLGMLPTSPATGVGFPHSRGNHLDHTICTAITNIYVLPYMASHGASMIQYVQ